MKMIKHKLGELLRVTRGASLPGTGYADSGKYLRLTLANFQEEGGFKEFKSTQGKFFVESFDSRFLMHKGDLITPLTEQSPGLLGSVAFVPCDGLYIQSQDVGLISCNTEMLDKRFAYYLFLTHSVREQISARSQQTKIRHTSPDKIADVEVYLPDLPTQLRIAGVLGSIDEKIELNRKKIAELEALAKVIYDYWFVQFDFPDNNGKPYKSSGGKMVWNEQLKREVPEGWGVVPLSSLCSISTRQCSPSKMDSDLLEHYSIPAFDEGVYPSFDSPSEILSNKFVVPIGGILYSKLNAQFKRIWDPLHLTGLPVASSEFVIYVPINPKLRGFVYATLNDERFYKFANSISSCSTGSRKRFTPETTNRFPVIVPTANGIAERFSAVCSDLLESIRKCRIETQALKHTRDTLLPLLMNGQAVVK